MEAKRGPKKSYTKYQQIHKTIATLKNWKTIAASLSVRDTHKKQVSAATAWTLLYSSAIVSYGKLPYGAMTSVFVRRI